MNGIAMATLRGVPRAEHEAPASHSLEAAALLAALGGADDAPAADLPGLPEPVAARADDEDDEVVEVVELSEVTEVLTVGEVEVVVLDGDATGDGPAPEHDGS